jgi:hypothetical protein
MFIRPHRQYHSPAVTSNRSWGAGRLRSLISQSPAIAIAGAALILSGAGGATAATVAGHTPATPVSWHNLTLINGWQNGGFGSFHAGYYVDSNHVVHLRGSARLGGIGKAAFRLPRGVRPSHILSLVIYTSGGAEEMNILPNGLAIPFDQTGTDSHVRDFTSLDGISFPQG